MYKSFSNKQLIQEFYRIWNESGVSKSNINMFVRNHFVELYAEIEQRTIKLNQYRKFKTNAKGKQYQIDISMFERLYCLENDLNDRPMCKVCGKKHVAGFVKHENKYCDYCSQACQRMSPECIAKQFATKEKKYGKDNITNAKKAHKTRISKYGSHHPDDYVKKVKSTKMKNYGDENYVNVDKAKATVKKHIEENPDYYFDREQKTKQTKIANGHDPNWNNRSKFKKTLSEFTNEKRQSIKDKRKQTCIDVYGCEFPMQSNEIKVQAQNTVFREYGVKSVLQLKYVHDKSIQAVKEKAWDHFCSRCHDIEPLFTKNEFIHCSLNESSKVWKWRCKECGHEFTSTWSNWTSRKCPKCHPHNYRGMQSELNDYVMSLCPENIVRYDCKSVLAKSRQLDVYIEDMKTAFEFNGIFWHNSDYSIYGKEPLPMMYHYDKTNECIDKGIKLVHIFEDEWTNHKKLCMSKIKKMLAPYKMIHVDANECMIHNRISQFEKEKYLLKYTFYGIDGSSIAYCLEWRRHIVAMMTFSKTRNNKQYEWQILNYIELDNIIVDGGFNALFKHFVDSMNPKNICLYASRDWTCIDDYSDVLDFIEVKRPRCYWTLGDERVHYISINKTKAKQIIDDYDDHKTLVENMNDNNYFRIYDSGVNVFSWHANY